MKISILCPTRGRPSNVKRLVNSISELTRDIGNVELMLYIDKDDKKTLSILEWLMKSGREFVNPVIEKRHNHLSKSWNTLWNKSTGEVFFLCGDDIVFENKGWDILVRENFNKFDDHIVYLYGEDGHRGHETHPFIHKNWTDTVGYFAPHNMSYGNDTWIMEVAKGLNMNERYIKDGRIKTTHMHYAVNKAQRDDVYIELHERSGRNKDGQRRLASMDAIKSDAEKLRQFIKNFR